MKLNKGLTLAMALLLGGALVACEEAPEEPANTCGNGVLDEGEVCEADLDIASWSQKTCEEYGTAHKDQKDWAQGTPGCAKDCRSLAKGTCISKEEAETLNGVKTCIAKVTNDGNKVSATVEVEPVDTIAKTSVKGSLVCAADTIIEAIQDKGLTAADADGKLSLSKEVTSVGDNYCVVYIEAESGKGIVCGDGNKVKAAGALSTLPNVKVTVADDGPGETGEVVAEWSDFGSLLNDKGYPDKAKTKETLLAGMKAEKGSASGATLAYVEVAPSELTVNITKDAATEAMSVLIAGNNNKDKNWAATKAVAKDANSHFLITEIGDGTKFATDYSTAGGKLAITTSDGSSETVAVDDKTTEKDVFDNVSVDIPAGTKEIRIYAYEMADQNLRLDNLKITK